MGECIADVVRRCGEKNIITIACQMSQVFNFCFGQECQFRGIVKKEMLKIFRAAILYSAIDIDQALIFAEIG